TLRNPNFAAIMQEVMNEKTDEETLKARREALQKSREQYAAARSAQATIETAYDWLEFCAGNLDTLDDAGFIERVDIFPERQPDGRWVKSIDFCFPVVLDGTELTHWSRSESNVETVVQLSKGEINSKKVRVEFSLEDMDMSGFQKGATYGQIKDYVKEHTGLSVSSLYIAQVKQKYGIIERENYNKPKSENTRQPQCPPEKEAAITEALKHFRMI
ncbi:MAG: hypothetical protein LUG26_09735, partial [Ruminococcus sp.]|nr:hypothetical protein [Ruminococcus sp.]